jgi:hypothetical protein
MICWNSSIEFTGRINTPLRASTPVESSCDVVTIVGIVFSQSWKSRRCCSPISPSLAVTRSPSCGSLLRFIWLIRSSFLTMAPL